MIVVSCFGLANETIVPPRLESAAQSISGVPRPSASKPRTSVSVSPPPG